MFDWCRHGDHSNCAGSYKKFFIERNKVVYTKDVVQCECKCHRRKHG